MLDVFMNNIIQKIDMPYLTTEFLLEKFKDYVYPRDKLKNLVKKNELIHICQGIYLPGADYQRCYSKEVLAGIIYGPSVVSFEYALSFYGFIPERVETITSLCFKRNKVFQTPVGTFTYRYIAKKKFSIGIHYEQTVFGNFFIATPEKALCDLAYFQKIENEDEAIEYIIDDLRIDEKKVLQLNIKLLLEIKKSFSKKNISCLVDSIIVFKNNNFKG
jgi:hypothetical protein